ncbi:DMT family transporter [Pseudohoeflea coraliihabitans]|uniref:DMT family transporter n=1 Tax=Pseudohoeflea coraliihabitans TaxID=2860393 RepID=A0ABS6WPX2_9HYPH|nr:DMT family transporter [Pseudohoeflea sp. DP4N28-3]MBW3098012.1 DMT family transporter [Pseudohoeflea sp. DP4N28-3]
MPLTSNQRGALFMSLALFGFTFNDTLVKAMSADMEMGQIIFVRGVIASLLIYLLARHRRAMRPLRLSLSPWFALRVIGEVGGTLTFLTGLAQIPIGTATAILMALPLAVTMGAALFLNEPVGWRRWSAIAAGFLGVLIIVRPGLEGFSPYALLIVGTVLFAASRDIATRKLDSSIPPLFISVVTSPFVALGGLLIDPPFAGNWIALDIATVALLALAAGSLLFGYHFIILSMRVGDISAVAPFRYTGFLYAVILGFIFFGDVPDLFMIIGGTIIIASGLYTLYREHVRADAGSVAAESPVRHTP